MDFITKALEDGYNIDELLLDFAKPVDSVLLLRLLLKLDMLGIRNNLLAWCKSFLSDPYQRVIIGEYMSEWKIIDSGVPQGSVLGPLIFVELINGL
jgi:ribonuclease P/MRP protein subunit RPP40